MQTTNQDSMAAQSRTPNPQSANDESAVTMNQQGDSLDAMDDNSPVEDDGTPVLDEQDLEDNDISFDEAEDIEWESEEETDDI